MIQNKVPFILVLALSSVAFSVFMNILSSLYFSHGTPNHENDRVVPLHQSLQLGKNQTRRSHYRAKKELDTCSTLCGCFEREVLRDASTIPTASSLWQHYSTRILDNSLRLDEAENKIDQYKEWVQSLFARSTTKRLLKTVETLPQDRLAIKSIHDKLESRWRGNSGKGPLKVVVFGGSLTAGHGCLENPLGLPTPSFLKRQLPCAWPSRTQNLLDVFLPRGLVNITNMAMAATTSDVGATVVDYQLWPPELQPDGPDIIIAAFSTNDALAEAPESEIYQNMQLLIESIGKERNCRKDKLPLLIYVDDFIAWPGSTQKYLQFHKDLHELSDWYGFGYISYANAFRDVVHADIMNEDTFKGGWKIEKRKVVANPHPGMSFHIVMAWVILYNLFHMALHTCDRSMNADDSTSDSIPSVARPPLTDTLLTEKISAQWKELEASEEERCKSMISSGSRCAFVWVANRVSKFNSAAAIDGFLQQFLTSNDGWKAEGNSYRSKHGWLAKKKEAVFTMKIAALDSDVRFVTILSLKSYGKDWEGSLLELNIAGILNRIEGHHNSETSVILPHKFDLGKTLERGSPLEIEFRLIGGSNFKITGMAFCSQ